MEVGKGGGEGKQPSISTVVMMGVGLCDVSAGVRCSSPVLGDGHPRRDTT